MGGRLAAAPRVARADAGEDLAEPLEARDGAGRQEVVDVREGGPHPAGQRLVAGRAGQRVEPDQPVAVAAQAGRLGRDERRIAAVPAVGDDDDDAGRAQRPPRPVLVELRNDSPIRVPPAQSLTTSATRASARSRSRSRSSRVTRVSRVPNTNDSVRTADDAESAWTNRSSSREWRSIEPEMSQRTTSERGSWIGRRQTHSSSWPPVPRLRRNIARGARRRPCEWSS